VLEAKSTNVSLSARETQGRRYADQLDVPFIFPFNGEEVLFCDKGQDAHFRSVETVFAQDDLVRRKGARGLCRDTLRFVPALTVFVAVVCCMKGLL
jgi:type I site-specific restriction endonuclease